MKKIKKTASASNALDAFLEYNNKNNQTITDKFSTRAREESVLLELLEDNNSFFFREFNGVGEAMDSVACGEPIFKIVQDRLEIEQATIDYQDKIENTLKRLKDRNYCLEKDVLDIVDSDVVEKNPLLFGIYLRLLSVDLSEFETKKEFEELLTDYEILDRDWRNAIFNTMMIFYPKEAKTSQNSNWRKYIEDHITELYTMAVYEACLRRVVEDINYILDSKTDDCGQSEDTLKKIYKEKDRLKKLLKDIEKESKKAEQNKGELEKTIAKLQKRLEESDREVSRLKEINKTLTDENKSLKSEISSINKQNNPDESLQSKINTLNGIIANKDAQLEALQGNGILKTEPIDLFPGEQYEFVVSILKQLLEKLNKETRAYEIVKSLVENNKAPSNGSEILSKLDSILSGKMELNKADLAKLEALGFTVTRGGKHIKLTFHNSKYIYTMSLTPSDYRTSIHRFVDIRKCIAVSTKI